MKSRFVIVAGVLVVGSLIALAYYRAGLLNLPSVSDQLTASDAGLDKLGDLRALDHDLALTEASTEARPLATPVRSALTAIRDGNEETGIHQLQDAVKKDPTNLVVGNALRMETMKLKRKWLAQSANQSEIALNFPEYLRDEPVRFLRELVRRQPSREAKLQLSLALVDHMLLFPALEIKAPSSVEAVEVLTDILNHESPSYVPALYARGLNYLYRPFNLVWPERIAAPVDAASNDLSLCVAIGQKIGAGSDRLKAELSLALGDAYAKEGKLSLARSWWQIANNIAHDEKFRTRVFARLQWGDEDVAASLEETLQHQMEDLDHPLSDLRFMWE
ncbi:MAG: hypothetical protein HYR76_00600 [Ignavibacteria bacterium]|nr:hypothetical protein [Ignavibacteria bacterium]MBI3766355.1 hypothetical protein [Ignavibacteriales bacterium]